MSTTAAAGGKTLTLRLGTTSTTTAIKNLKSNSLSQQTDFREVTTKDSGSHKEYVPTFQDLTIDFAGLFTDTATNFGYEDIQSAKLAGTLLYWEWGSGVTGTEKITGTGYIASLQKDAEYDGNVEFSGTIQNTGDPTPTTYP